MSSNEFVRKTSQYELPVIKGEPTKKYDVYPSHHIGRDKIAQGYERLALALKEFRIVKLDGYSGVLFERIKEQLQDAFNKSCVEVRWINVEGALRNEEEVNELIAPYLGGEDPIFGKVCPLELSDFFSTSQLDSLIQNYNDTLTIYYGTGASLVPVEGRVVFIDVAKNEIQFRSRAGVVRNLGATHPLDAKKMYKRFYFVDWMVLNRHFESIKNKIDVYVDGQRSDTITWMSGNDWREALNDLSARPVRVRPWFEPGAWGGKWILNNISGLPKDVVNYAWSFELITPENGIILESSELLLETSFDSWMWMAGKNILGRDYDSYGHYFPIRFDFLDTFDGGNLSVQCHPRKEYMREHFGEAITQEETYYILDRQKEAKVYLGFQEGVTPEIFEKALTESYQHKIELDIEKYVQSFPAEKHDLFLIPPGTIHASGKDTLVLEISSTPYIYTFKMYDWLRLDLDGRPRPMNIERGMDNLVFDRAGAQVAETLIAKPVLLDSNSEFQLFHLATHEQHLYDVYRYVIQSEVSAETSGKVHVLSLVEGQAIDIIIDGIAYEYNHAETFIIPAIVGKYTIKNKSGVPVMVVKAFIK